MFRLVPDQLRISSGWVRCGQCTLAFDARSQMLGDADAVSVEVAAARQALAARAAATQNPDRPRDQAALPAMQPLPRSKPPASTPPPPKPAQPYQELGSMTHEEVARWRAGQFTPAAVLTGGPLPGAAQPESQYALQVLKLNPHLGDSGRAPPWAAPDTVPTWKDTEGGAIRPAVQAREPEEPPEAAPGEALSFVREARRRAFWQSAPMRALLWLLLALLAAALALQMALTRRDWLAAAYPATKPALRLLCRVAGCEVGPYRYLEGMAVESSSFTQVTGNVYQFSVTLRNNAALPVATPALDLTLNDMQGQPVLRRVIAPAELGAPAALAAGSEFAGTARLTLGSLPEGAAVIGYRVEAFYP